MKEHHGHRKEEEAMTKTPVFLRTRGAVIYTRVSTGEQDKHGTSPETQLAACRAKALALALPIVAEYYDGGISGGFLLMRTEFQAALTDIQEGRADTLLCPNISRFSRDVEHQQSVKKAVRAAGGRLVFCDAEFEDTAAGDLNFDIQGSFAAYERKVIRERTYGGHTRRAAQGIQTGRCTSPFGYVIPKNADILRGTYPAEQLGKYLIVEAQAAIVRELFALYDAGRHSLNDLSKTLNRSGLPTPGGGKLWRASNVRYILTNPVYKGQAAFGRFDHATDEARLMQSHARTGLPLTCARFSRPAEPETWITWAVPAIVSEDVWGRTNARLLQNKKLRGGNPGTVRMLSGRVFCPSCGTGMACLSPTHARSKKPGSQEVYTYPHRYACGEYRRRLLNAGEKVCVPDGYYVHEVEAAVVLALLDACQRPASVRDALAAHSRQQEETKPPAPLDARTEMASADKALADLAADDLLAVQAQMAGMKAGASPDAYAAVFAELAGRRKDLEDRRGTLARSLRSGAGASRAEPKAADPPPFTELLEKARLVLESPDVPGAVKRDIVGSVIEKVICLKGEGTGKERQPAGARVVFLPGVFADAAEEHGFCSSLQTALGVLVIESPADSGSLITAREAGDQGRDVFAIPGPIGMGHNAGCHKLIQDGAKLVECVDDILSELGILTLQSPDSVGKTLAPVLNLPPEQRRILDMLTLHPRQTEGMIHESGLSAPQVAGILTLLEMRGLARRVPGNAFVRVL